MQASHARNLLFWQKNPPMVSAGQVVMVTGAGSGIGLNVSLIYASRGCKLILLDRDASALSKAQSQCESTAKSAGSSSSLEILTLTVDVTDYPAVQTAVSQALDRFTRLDVLVLCAGLGAHHLFADTHDLTIFHKLMNVNFFGYLHCVRAAYQALTDSNGRLIAVTSFSGEVGLPYRTAYCSSKFAVTGFLESLRSEMSVVSPTRSFHITICCPPTVNTNLRRNSLTLASDSTSLKPSQPADSAMTVQDCAAAIVDAGDRKLRKAFFPWNSWIASYLRPIIPDAMDKFIMAKAKL